MEEGVVNGPNKDEEFCQRFNECEDKFKFNPDAPEYFRRLKGCEDRFKFNPDAPEDGQRLHQCDDEFRFNPDAPEFILPSSDILLPRVPHIEYIKCIGEPDPATGIRPKTNPPGWLGSGDATARMKEFGGNFSSNLGNHSTFVSQPPPNFKSPWIAGSGYRIFTPQNSVSETPRPEDIVGNENDAPLLIAPFASQVPLSEFQPVYQLIGYAEPPLPSAPASVLAQVPSSNVQVPPDNYSEVNMRIPVTQNNFRMQIPQQTFSATRPLWQPDFVPRHRDPSYGDRRTLQPFPQMLLRPPIAQQQRMPNFPMRIGPSEQQRFYHNVQPRLPQPPRLSLAPNPITATPVQGSSPSPFVNVLIPNVDVFENGSTRRIPSLIPIIFPSTSRGRRRY